MLWDVVLSREEGRLIPGFLWGRLMAYRGRIVVEYKHMAILKRPSMVATLLEEPRGSRKPVDLWDAHLVKFNHDYLVFAGYERVGGDEGQDFAQTWVIQPATTDVVEPRGGTMWT